MTRLLLGAFLILSAASAHADVRLPKIIGSKMVLQRNSDVKIWGWADAGETVNVVCDWRDTRFTTEADDDGNWQVHDQDDRFRQIALALDRRQNKIEVTDILFGEVWLASGQSNMEMPLVKVSGAYTGIKDAADEVANAKHPEIRLFQVGNFSSKKPLDDVESGITMYGIPPSQCEWQACSPKTIPTFASTAYFFARELHVELDVPIGIIDSSWGGTPAEAWTSAAGLRKLGYANELKQAADRPTATKSKTPDTTLQRHDPSAAQFQNQRRDLVSRRG